jgi:hypothetical protein
MTEMGILRVTMGVEMNLRVDLKQQRLVPLGPVPAAGLGAAA